MTKRVLLTVLVFAMMATAAYGQLANTPWPKVRADERNTSSTSAAAVAAPFVAWKVAVDAGAENAGVTLDKNENVVYMDVSGTLKSVNSGGVIWEVSDFGNVVSGPVVADRVGDNNDRIYVQNAYSGDLALDALVALNVSDGSLIWSLPIYAGSSTGPTVGSDGIIYMAAGDSFYCVQDNGTSASVIWSSGLPATPFAGPLALNDGVSNDDRIYVSSNHSVMCVQQDGAASWSVVWQVTDLMHVRRCPTIGLTGDVFASSLNWSAAVIPQNLYCLDGATGAVKWSKATKGVNGGDGHYDSAPSFDSAGTTLYVTQGGGGTDLMAFDPTDGSLKWSLQVDPSGGSASAPSIVDVGGTTYIYAAHGPSAKVYCVKDEGTSASLFWSFEADASCWGAAALGSDGTVYLASVGGGSEVIALLPYDGTSVEIITTSLPKALPFIAYSEQLTAWGGTLPYTWTIDSGTLPTGLTLSTSGLISGTTSDPGTHNFVVKVTDSAGTPASDTQALSILVEPDPPTITGGLPEGYINQPYSASLSASGGWPPYTFSITGGSEPPGITMDTDGNFTGTPVTMGTYLFSVTVTDSWSNPLSDTMGYGLSIFIPVPVIEDVRRSSLGQIEIEFNTWGDTVKIESSTDPYNYDEDLMNWTVEATGLGSGTWTDANTPTSGEKYYRVFYDSIGVWSGRLLAYEPFDYEVGSEVVGQSGGEGWRNAWSNNYPKVEDATIDVDGLSYLSLPVKGGSAHFVITDTVAQRLDIVRHMAEPVHVQGTTMWYSALIKPNTVDLGGSDDYWCGPGNWGWYQFGRYQDNSLRIAHHSSTGVLPEAGETYLFIERIDYIEGAGDELQLWINPNSVDPNDPPVDASDALGYTSWTAGSEPGLDDAWLLAVKVAGSDCQWDELRAAESWSSLVSNPPDEHVTVGMMVKNMVLGRNIVSSPFEPFPDGGGTPGSASLDKIVDNQLTGHPVSQWAADKIEAWDVDLQTYIGAWLRAGQGWTDWNTMLDPATFGIDSDTGYWFKLNSASKDVMFFGQVSPVSREIEIKSQRNMLGTCYPVSSKLGDCKLVTSGFTGHPVSQWASDKIEYWDSAGQTYVGIWRRTIGGPVYQDNFEDNVDGRFILGNPWGSGHSFGYPENCTMDFDTLTNELVLNTIEGSRFAVTDWVIGADPAWDPAPPWDFKDINISFKVKWVLDSHPVDGQTIQFDLLSANGPTNNGKEVWVRDLIASDTWQIMSFRQGTGDYESSFWTGGWQPTQVGGWTFLFSDENWVATDEVHIKDFVAQKGLWSQWNTMGVPPVPPYDAFDPGEGWWIKANVPYTWKYPRP